VYEISNKNELDYGRSQITGTEVSALYAVASDLITVGFIQEKIQQICRNGV